VSGDTRIQLDAVRPTPNRHVYEDRDAGGFRSHDGPCRDGNCVPYHRFVCRDCTDTEPCERMKRLIGEDA
jgi:hypothetical protein